jgi:hypothetical protein
MAEHEGKWLAGSLGVTALTAIYRMLASLPKPGDLEQLVLDVLDQLTEARSRMSRSHAACR